MQENTFVKQGRRSHRGQSFPYRHKYEDDPFQFVLFLGQLSGYRTLPREIGTALSC